MSGWRRLPFCEDRTQPRDARLTFHHVKTEAKLCDCSPTNIGGPHERFFPVLLARQCLWCLSHHANIYNFNWLQVTGRKYCTTPFYGKDKRCKYALFLKYNGLALDYHRVNLEGFVVILDTGELCRFPQDQFPTMLYLPGIPEVEQDMKMSVQVLREVCSDCPKLNPSNLEPNLLRLAAFAALRAHPARETWPEIQRVSGVHDELWYRIIVPVYLASFPVSTSE